MRHLFVSIILMVVCDICVAQSPIINADVPDMSVCRVGNDYYMVSTTMHLMPGCPVMKSQDLRHWKTISYVFPRIDDAPRYSLLGDSTAYGQGQWASCIRYRDGRYYVWFTANGAPGLGFVYTATAPEGPWTLISRPPHFHDGSLFFDDDGRVYMFYGSGQVREMRPDLKGVLSGGLDFTIPVRDIPAEGMAADDPFAKENGLLEGSNMIKRNGKYYLLMISWPRGGKRREVCYRADNIVGPYEKKVILDYALPPFSGGVAQGTIVDTPQGEWWGIFFQDRNGIGRTPCLMPCRWEKGWPMIVPKVVDGVRQDGIIGSDDFNDASLSLYWQWNHNPMDEAWSLTERKGFLRLTTARCVDNLFLAPNTLTQRMEGLSCQGTVCLDVVGMKDGDHCGFAAFNSDSGVLEITKEGKKHYLTMLEENSVFDRNTHGIRSVETKQCGERIQIKNKVYLRIKADFTDGKDVATFYYSTDGVNFRRIGFDFRMGFDYLRFFMGTKFAIFNYATRKTGGHIDVDFFHYSNP